MYVYNSSPYFESNIISDAKVYLNNSYSFFADNYVHDAEWSYLMYIYGGSPTFYNNTIDAGWAMVAVNVNNGGSPVFGGNPGGGYNKLMASFENDAVIWAENGGTPNLGSGSAGPYYAGYNSILQPGGFSPAAAIDGSSSIDAAYCWWGRYPAPYCYGNVNTADALNFNPGGGSSLDKKSTGTQTIVESAHVYSEAELQWLDALKYYSDKEYPEALALLNEIITTYEDVKVANKAINLIDRLYHETGLKGNITTMDFLLSTIENDSIRVALEMKKIQNLKKNGKYDNAIGLCKKMLINTNGNYKKLVLFDLFNLYQKDKKNSGKAKQILNILKTDYPDDDLTLIARMDNGEQIDYVKKSRKDLIQPEEPFVDPLTEFTLNESYPNPFNPVTNISFDLPENSHVT
ncbi:MAG: hypothetical protein KAI81_00530, partial [Candidatus Marinimicrobia bacterium]|nr:hypothetical protein [Candidatus Neomarinimicrobiota bacterium]